MSRPFRSLAEILSPHLRARPRAIPRSTSCIPESQPLDRIGRVPELRNLFFECHPLFQIARSLFEGELRVLISGCRILLPKEESRWFDKHEQQDEGDYLAVHWASHGYIWSLLSSLLLLTPWDSERGMKNSMAFPPAETPLAPPEFRLGHKG